jgi:hypothetical protein
MLVGPIEKENRVGFLCFNYFYEHSVELHFQEYYCYDITMADKMRNNRAIAMLDKAAKEGYGVPGTLYPFLQTAISMVLVPQC